MVSDEDLVRIPGIREVSSFFRNFGGEDVVIRPANTGAPAFKIEVLLNGDGKAVFPPAAPVHEGDLVERSDPRGGVIEYSVQRYEFSKDPFGHGNDHWNAYLVEKRHVARDFAQPNIVVKGGVNQFAVGDRNSLQMTNQTVAFPEVVASLEEIRRGIPRDALSTDRVEEIDEAIDEAARVAADSDKPRTVKRALHAVNGVLGEVAESVRGGAVGAVKAWATAAMALLLKHLTGL